MGESGVVLAIDYGRARLGVAISDALGISVKPIGHIDRASDEQAAHIIACLIKEQKAQSVVIGLPLHAHGDAGENVTWVRAFVKQLQKHISLPIYEVDERYSSSEAEDYLKLNKQWPVSNPGIIDARAACIILQRYLSGET